MELIQFKGNEEKSVEKKMEMKLQKNKQHIFLKIDGFVNTNM